MLQRRANPRLYLVSLSVDYIPVSLSLRVKHFDSPILSIYIYMYILFFFAYEIFNSIHMEADGYTYDNIMMQ